jgi:hypothetical protein
VPEARDNANALLRLLGERYATAEVTVGGPAAAAQAIPLPGTVLVGGETQPDRPHRPVHVVRWEETQVDLFGLLKKDIAAFLAEENGQAQASAPTAKEDDLAEKAVDRPAAPANAGAGTAPTTTPPSGTGWDRETASRVLAGVLERAEIPFRVRTKSGLKHYEFTFCPLARDPEGRHTHKCSVFVHGDGRFGARCRHDEDANWVSFKLRIGWFDHAPQVMRELGVAPRSCPYRATDAGLFYLQRHRGHRRKVRMTNFTARIVRDIEGDDGVETTHLFEIEACVDGKASRFQLTAAEFAAMAWPAQRLGARAVTFPGGSAGHIRAAIQLLSGDVQTETRFTHLGWRTVGGENVYLHAGGGVGQGGVVPGVQVELPEQLSRYRLPPPPSGAALRKAVAASLRVLDIAPDAVTVPLYGGVWRAALVLQRYEQRVQSG